MDMRDALESDGRETGRRAAAAAFALVGSVGRGGSTDAPTARPDVAGAGDCKSLAGRAI